MSYVTNVFRRGGRYYFRTRVPKRLRACIGRLELWRSLKTSDLQEARRRASCVVLLTDDLWKAFERLMTSSSSMPSPDQIQLMIDHWLKVELDRDASLRRKTEFDREGAWFPGVIMERTPDGVPEKVVEYLDEAQIRAVDTGARAPITSPQYLLTDVNEVHLERGQRHKVFQDSVARFERGDTSIAARHAAELFEHHGFRVDLDSDEFDIAARMMVRAHQELLVGTQRRDVAMWRPYLDNDPLEDLVRGLGERAANLSPPAKANKTAAANVSRRARLPFSVAAKEAISEMARTDDFKIKRVDDYENAASSFVDWCGHDPLLGEVTAEDAGDYQVALGQYPTNAKKRAPYRSLPSFEDRRARAVEIGELNLLGPVTINGKYLTPLRRIFDWHAKAGSGLANPFIGIEVRKPRQADPRTRRRSFSTTELQRLFDLPVFTGAEADAGSGLARSGSIRVSDWRYWVPLICVFSGMRLNEACGLALSDIKVEQGIAFFHVRDETEGQSIKAEASRRKVPIHADLLSLGILDQVRQWRDAGRVRLFDELKPDSKGYFSHKPSKRLNALIERIVDADPDEPGKLVFHSTRHTVATRLRAANVRKDVSEAIVGHEGTDTHSGYGTSDIPTLKDAVDRIVYPGLDLSKVRLTSLTRSISQ